MKFPTLNQLQLIKKKTRKKTLSCCFKAEAVLLLLRNALRKKMVLVQTHKPHCTLLSTKTHNSTAHLSGATVTQPHTEETTQCHIVQEKQVIVNTLWTAWISSQLIIHWISSSAGDKKFPSQIIKTVETKIKLLKWGNVTLRSVHSRPSSNVS